MNKPHQYIVDVIFHFNTNLLASNWLDTMHAIELRHKGVFIPTDMLIITRKHLDKNLSKDDPTLGSV